MTQIDSQIGHKIKTKRRKMGTTQADLAKKLSISPSYLNLIESGRRPITVPLLIKLGNILGISQKCTIFCRTGSFRKNWSKEFTLTLSVCYL